jgi:prepilin-type N-terminal cleavage/methylation domain-containing protein
VRPAARGFTLIELLTVILVLTVLSGIALLKYLDLRNTARAAQVAGDFRAVMVAAYNYYADKNAWPADGAAGTTPAALAPYLPGGFQFTRPEYVLDYDNFGVGGGDYIVGVTVSSGSADLMAKLIRNLGTRYPYFAAAGTLTYIIVGPNGGA